MRDRLFSHMMYGLPAALFVPWQAILRYAADGLVPHDARRWLGRPRARLEAGCGSG